MRFGRFQYIVLILGEKGVSGIVKRLLDVVFLGGRGIIITLPFVLKWYMNTIYQTSSENYYFLLGFLYFTGIICLELVHEIRKIFKTLNRRNPFMMDNVNFRIYTGSTHWGCF
jgi:hypothetical protein